VQSIKRTNYRKKCNQSEESIRRSEIKQTSPINGRVSWLKYYIEHFEILDVKLLTLPHPLRVNIHNGFHFIGIDMMATLSVAQLSMKAQLVRT
jgi:hypothetical protein